MRNRFDQQLEQLEKMLTHMGELCALAITKATGALEKGDVERAKEVIDADEEIDQMEKDIERLCMRLLLQQQPVAKDLRRISAALKMITDMERIGDQTADIAEIVISAKIAETGDIEDISHMAAASCKMVRDSVTAYVEKNLVLAQQVEESDDEVDELFMKVRRELVAIMANTEDVEGDRMIDVLMIAKYLERIADHATNVAEWVEFSITGVHRGVENFSTENIE